MWDTTLEEVESDEVVRNESKTQMNNKCLFLPRKKQNRKPLLVHRGTLILETGSAIIMQTNPKLYFFARTIVLKMQKDQSTRTNRYCMESIVSIDGRTTTDP